MLINLDAKALEWVAAVYLSQDKIGLQELAANVDIHGVNQHDLELPSRLIAKKYLFRMIYGGSAWSYANDIQFQGISDKPNYWQKVIDRTYEKYVGLGKWHNQLQKEVSLHGKIEMPTGRVYTYKRVKNERTGEMKWPVTTILNYPVQGFGADLMTIIRISLHKRLRKAGLKALLLCTVHDSILIDCIMEEVDEVIKMIFKVFEDLPRNFEKIFKIPLNVELKVEIQVGKDWKNMTDIKKEDYT